MKKVILILLALLSLSKSVNAVSDYIMEADYAEYSFRGSELKLKLKKDALKDIFSTFEININSEKIILSRKILDKIISPVLTEIEVSKSFDENSYRVEIPFYYFSKNCDYPDSNKIELRDNLLIISIEEDSTFGISVFLEDENKRISLR